MFRVSSAPEIRSTRTAVTNTGASHEFEDKIRLKIVRGQAGTSLWSWPN